MYDFNSNINRIKWILQNMSCRARSDVSPQSHALEHLGVGVEGEHGGASHPGAVQKAEGQALHECQRRGLGCAVVYGAGYGWEGQDGVDTDDVSRLKLQHTRQERFCSLRDKKNNRQLWERWLYRISCRCLELRRGKEWCKECLNRKWGFPFLKQTRSTRSSWERPVWSRVKPGKVQMERSRRSLRCAKCFDGKSVIWNFPRSYTKWCHWENEQPLVLLLMFSHLPIFLCT